VIAWLSALALGGPPPPDLVIDDPLPWDTAAKAMIDGPPGCHDATGIARFTLTLHEMPDLLSAPRAKRWVYAGRIEGKLVDGTWTPLTARLAQIEPPPEGDEVDEDAGSDLLPLVGTRTDSRFSIGSGGSKASIEGENAPMNLVRRAIDDWGGSQETAFVQWDAGKDAVMLRREIPITDKNLRETSRVEVFFPAGGLLPTQEDVIFPHSVTVGDWPWRARLQDAQMHVRAEIRAEKSWPTFESASLVASVLGFTVGIEQTILWEGWAECSGN
jgi:hypothetical protein